MRFQSPVTLLTGDNGAGKTSIIEAIYYLCYFKSFRSHLLSDLLHTDCNSFFLKGSFLKDDEFGGQQTHALQIGYSQHKKSIKLDQKNIASHKEILSWLQVVALTEDDITLIDGYPAHRRAFVDQAVLLSAPEKLALYQEFKQILHNRNALLFRAHAAGKLDPLEFEVWTKKLWQVSVQIQQARRQALQVVSASINSCIEQFFDQVYEVALTYQPEHDLGSDFDLFFANMQTLQFQERMLKRSLFGAHLDDVVFHIRGKKARIFASRGQQKLIALLAKLSLCTLRLDAHIKPILLVDDFISDFDKIRLQNLVSFFSFHKNQIILTAPFLESNLLKILQKADPEIVAV